jgi:hypothetical protein
VNLIKLTGTDTETSVSASASVLRTLLQPTHCAKLRIRRTDVETSTCSYKSVLWVPVLSERCTVQLQAPKENTVTHSSLFVSCLLVRVKRDMKVHVLVSVFHSIATRSLLVLSAFRRAFLHMNPYAIYVDVYLNPDCSPYGFPNQRHLKHSAISLNIHELCILPTEVICVFRTVLTINSDCFPKQH